jgi:hypothetical protein
MAEVVLPGSVFPVCLDANEQIPAALNNATITVSGSTIVNGYGTSEVIIFITVAGAVSGTLPTLSFTLAEVDPNDNITVIGSSTTSSTITATGFRQTNSIAFTYSDAFKISWTVGGTAPSFAGVTVTVSGKQTSTKLVDAQGLSLAPSKALQVVNTPKVFKSSSNVLISFNAIAPSVADAILSVIKTKEGVSSAGATSITASGGTVMRLTGMHVSIKSNAAAAAFATVTIRQNPAGTTVLGSNILFRTDVGNTAAAIGASAPVSQITFPDGLDFTGTQSLGITLAAQAITNIMSITLFGYEYFA